MQDLKSRFFEFAVAVGKLYDSLPMNDRNQAYMRQLIRSSSSVGANYRAALKGKSTADFLHKLKITEEEADESLYFLELLLRFNQKHESILAPLVKEANEICKIIVASIVTTKSKMK